MSRHEFESTAAAYNACQCDDAVRNGDILVIESEKVVGVAYAWPLAVTEEAGELHRLDGDIDTTTVPDEVKSGYRAAVKVAFEQGWPLRFSAPSQPGTGVYVRYTSIDGASQSERFDDVAAASKWACDWVGPTPEFGTDYAVSADGIGKVTVTGATLAELFPAVTEPQP